MSDAQPRLILHVGTPKTGSTTLQSACDAARASLGSRQILYPAWELHPRPPKHQWLVDCLLSGDNARLSRNFGRLYAETQDTGIRSVLLSAEGIYHHWPDFPVAAKQALRAECERFELTLWCVFREPLPFALSMYAQLVKNPPVPLAPCYATAEAPEAVIAHPWCARRLDYAGFVRELDTLFGPRRVKLTRYESGDILAQARELLGIDAAVLPAVPAANRSLSALGIDLARRLNQLGLDDAARQRAMADIIALDRLLAPTSAPIAASPAFAACVDALSRESRAFLDQRCGMRWDDRSSPPAIGPANSPDDIDAPAARRDAPAARRLAVGCVADSSAKYLDQALRLLQSWRWFAGEMAAADFYVCVVEAVPPEYRDAYEALDAHVRIVQRFSAAHPPSNKLRFLELPELAGADRVVLLDCDTLVVQPPLRLFSTADLAAKMADFATVPQAVFARLFAAFELPLPPAAEHCTVSGQPTIAYFNAGVLSFSPRAMDRLVPAWLRFNRALLEQPRLLGDASHFCEQASLSLALAACQTRYEAFGNEMNFPAHCRDLPPDSGFGTTDPVIIHYHALIDRNGLLEPSPYARVDQRLRTFNARLSRERRGHFDNGLFWNRRYLMDPELGSGVGSRGAVASYKRGLLERTVATVQPASILDVGCGDMAVSAILPATGYLGIDVAAAAIEANAVRFADRDFRCGDLLDMALDARDLVICLDVLIHVAAADRYRALVTRCVELAAHAGIVAAYESPPPHPSPITFFHEPISATLAAAGAVDIRDIGAYHQVRVFRFDTPRRQAPMWQAPMWQAQGQQAPGRQAQTALRRPVFVVGAMRSGTTLLADTLGQSPHIAHCPFELKDLWSQAGVAMASPKTRDLQCRECDAVVATPAMRDRLTESFLARMSALPGKHADAVLLNKNPHLCNKLPLVRALFPDARFIWIHRALPQTVASIKRLFAEVQRRQSTWHCWPAPAAAVRNRCWHACHSADALTTLDADRVFPGGDIRYLAEYWLESNRAVAEFFAQTPGAGVALSYEQFVKAPADALARLQGFVEVPFAALADNVAGVDRNRDQEWSALLNAAEIDALAGFVEANGEEIDGIFPGERPAGGYLRDLRRHLEPVDADRDSLGGPSEHG